MPYGLPSMDRLKEYLLRYMSPEGNAEVDAWLQVRTALNAGDNLELAMTDKILPVSLTNKIVRLTWKCVNDADYALFRRAIVSAEDFPFARLLHGLTSSTNTTVDVVTTNYDRVVEYACDIHGLICSTGFMPGYIQQREGTERLSFLQGSRAAKTVRLWKVHGSLDWFERRQDEVFSAPVFELPDESVTPLIVTPGLGKHEQTHFEPFRSVISGADSAFEKATAILCIGYGFRDSHIEPKLIQKCRNASIPVAVVARTLTDEAKAFLRNRAGKKYIAFEKSEVGTRVFTDESPDGFDLAEPDLWSLTGFLSLAT